MSQEEGVITVSFGRDVYQGNYLEDLAIDENKINEMLKTQPSRYVFWSKMVAMAKAIYEQKKLELERYTSQLYTFFRREAEAAGRRETEATLQAKIRLDQKTQQLENELVRVKLKLDHLAAIKEAFSQRTQMLMSLAANLREEFSSLELSVYEKTKELENRRSRR